jgi:hypothetical protein
VAKHGERVDEGVLGPSYSSSFFSFASSRSSLSPRLYVSLFAASLSVRSRHTLPLHVHDALFASFASCIDPSRQLAAELLLPISVVVSKLQTLNCTRVHSRNPES